MQRSSCALILSLLGFIVLAESASADTHEGAQVSPRWLVVPAFLEEDVEALLTTTDLVRHDLAGRGEAVWRADRASERFEVVGSAPAPELSQNDIDRWVERSRAAVRYLARADYKAARRELKAAQGLADRAAAELNREAARAQQVLDTCLFMVRAYVETRNGAEARRQARECRRLVPRIEPTAFRHTPEVRDLLAEVDREMATEAPGSLSVKSTPADCLVRINGVAFGRTPLSDIELPVGTYRLQVECEREQRGRIHRIQVRSGANPITIDVGLDQAVHTRPMLHLAYSSRDAWASTRMRDAALIARTLGTNRALVVSEVNQDIVRIDLEATGFDAASVWLRREAGVPAAEDVHRGVDALLEGRSVDFTGPHPRADASWRVASPPVAIANSATEAASSKPLDRARPHGQRVAGWSLFALGVASMGATVGLHVHRGTLGDRFIAAPSNLQSAQDWQDARVPVWVLAGTAGATMTAAMPLLLPDRERTPWWGWTLGAAGLGLAAYGIYQGATMTDCPDPFITDATAVQACVNRGQDAGRVALSIAGAAPLLTVPLVYLFRPLRVTPSMTVSEHGAELQLRRTF